MAEQRGPYELRFVIRIPQPPVAINYPTAGHAYERANQISWCVLAVEVTNTQGIQ